MAVLYQCDKCKAIKNENTLDSVYIGRLSFQEGWGVTHLGSYCPDCLRELEEFMEEGK